MQKVALVTGGAGFIGSHVCNHLLRNGVKVIALDDLSGGFVDNLPKGSMFVQGSILDRPLVNGIFQKEQIDYVFHLAAYAAEGLSHFIKHFNYQNNLIGSINLINAAIQHRVKCFVFTSSIAVYGKGQLPMTEDMMPMPEDSYGISKYAVEMELRACHEMFGLNSIIFRPHNVYGEHQNIGDRYRNVIGIFMNQIMRGEPLTIFGDGTQMRAFSYIDDVAPVIARSIDTPAANNEIFNIGADTPYTVNELAETVSKAMGVDLNIRYLDARNEVQFAYSDHEKAKRVFDLIKPVTLKDGISRMAAWAKKAGPRESKPFENIEIAMNLPPSWKK